MTMPAYDMDYEASYRESMALLPELTGEQLRIVLPVLREFARHNNDEISVNDETAMIKPQTEAQLLARIDDSLAQIERGEWRDLTEFVAEMEAELNA